jgi:anti-sigma28 factor (negative regulator of flagellin synthesis)
MPQVTQLREQFGIERMVLVGDRGMISQKAIDEMSQDHKRKLNKDSTDSTSTQQVQLTQPIQPVQPIAYAEAKAKVVKTATQPDGFDLFYQAYPKKVAKSAAAKAFKSAKVNANIDLVLADIRNRIASGEWKLDQKQFIPNPASYLNGRRWEDEAGTVEAAAPWTGAR